jgi:hypothetical protein
VRTGVGAHVKTRPEIRTYVDIVVPAEPIPILSVWDARTQYGTHKVVNRSESVRLSAMLIEMHGIHTNFVSPSCPTGIEAFGTFKFIDVKGSV